MSFFLTVLTALIMIATFVAVLMLQHRYTKVFPGDRDYSILGTCLYVFISLLLLAGAAGTVIFKEDYSWQQMAELHLLPVLFLLVSLMMGGKSAFLQYREHRENKSSG